MEKNIKNKKSQVKFLFKIGICLALLFVVFLSMNTSYISFAVEKNNETEFCYLSDIEYDASKTTTAWDQIRYDEVNGGGSISVKVEGAYYTFEKGIWAHATSTVVYDLTNYSQYDYFTAYIGLNQTSTKGNGVKFYIYTSTDGQNWNLKTDENPVATTPGSNAQFVKIDIKGAKYLKLYANDNNGNGQDHAVYADAKLVKEGYDDSNGIKSVTEYDKILKNKDSNQLIAGDYELTLLQRELTKNAGEYALKRFANESEENKQTLSWLMNDVENLRLYVLGGKPDGGSYYNSLTELSKLYHAEYTEITRKNRTDTEGKPAEVIMNGTGTKKLLRNDFEDNTPAEVTKYYQSYKGMTENMTKGDVYKKMAISLSLTHSTAVGYWAQIGDPSNRSDALERYRIYKYLYDNNKFVVLREDDSGKPLLNENNIPRHDQTIWFETLEIEEMRYVMNNISDNEELIWLNEYTQKDIDRTGQTEKYLQPHTYIAYIWPNFAFEPFHSADEKQYFDDWFNGIFSSYHVTHSSDVGRQVCKAWMSMRNGKYNTGAVCGGISKLGTHIRAAHGAPASVISQPGHAAIIYYRKDGNGLGYWTMDNGINGWGQSGKTEKLGTRMPLGWGSDSYVSGWAASYIVMAQEALNHNEAYEQSEKLIMTANIYNDNPTEKEKYLRKALESLPYNVDAWWELIKLYQANPNTTEAGYFALAEEMAEALKAFPLPMYNLTNLLKNNLTSPEYSFAFSLLQTRILTEGKNATAQTVNVYQPSVTKDVASFLLGQMDTSLASFSFDGDDSGKIVLSSRFDGNGIRWDYSLDGKQSWNEVSFSADEEHKIQLTKEQIASITSENDIYVHIVGASYDEANLYKIDIQESNLGSNLYVNDLENKLMGATSNMQWKLNEADKWTFYSQEEPDLSGDKTLTVRVGATGVYLASKESKTYNFTMNNEPDTRKYIPISHLSVHAVSTEATSNSGAAANAIDGNPNTRYHSAWNGTDTQRYIIIKLDKPVYLSAVEYMPAGGGNGKIYDGTIYGSMDGENWDVLSQQKNLTYTNAADTIEQAIANTKSFEIENPSKVQYVKIVADRTNGNWFTARMFNLYEDTTTKVSARFSFDGNNAGKIVLDKTLNWQYSLDSGATWNVKNTESYQLTAEEIEQINENDKIKIRFDGNEAEYTINIKKGNTPEITPYVNDLENRLIGLSNSDTLEWKLSDGNSWTSYEEQEPIVQGNKTLFIRTKATGTYTASDILEYEFTEDNYPDTEKYIPISHLSIHAYSTQSKDSTRPFYAPNAIDGNLNTLWHTDFAQNVLQQSTKPFISIKLDEPKYISALEFIQRKYRADDPAYIKNGIVYVSMDGQEWTEAGRKDNCAQNDEIKRINFNESVYGQYVKLEMDTYNMFASAAMINLYEDTTKNENESVIPTATVEYDITEATKENVTAKLINPSTEITVTNNNGSTSYTFNNNGEFTFEFKDKYGNKGSTTAKVNWIDKKVPIPTISYDITELTNQDVTATIKFDKENVTVTDGNTHTFTENGSFEFKFIDKVGNEGTAEATVNWIDKTAPIGTIKYSTTEETTGSVIATLISDEEIVITNNNGKNTYVFTKNGNFEFEFKDKAGNTNKLIATVDWIDEISKAPYIEYSITEETTNPVTVTLVSDDKITILNNNGENTYTFTKNGSFEFVYQDEDKNEYKMNVTVNWIKKKAPTVRMEYSTTEETTNPVTATLVSDDKITILNNNGENTYTFNENGSFEFVYQDEDKNEYKMTATVDWIKKKVPTVRMEYSTTEETTNPVTATLVSDDKITILNNNGKNTYTFNENGSFEFIYQDEDGNEYNMIATVSCINKSATNSPIDQPTANVTIKYSTTNATTDSVIAMLISDGEVTILNNNGKDTYTFTKNGSFEFVYQDKSGNEGRAKATVDWITSEPTKEDLPSSTTNDSTPNINANINTNTNTNSQNKPNNTNKDMSQNIEEKDNEQVNRKDKTNDKANTKKVEEEENRFDGILPKTGIDNGAFIKKAIFIGIIALVVVIIYIYKKI